jgi:multiple sugar transport system substrate-binding protein
MPQTDFSDDPRITWRRLAFFSLLLIAILPVVYRLLWRADRVSAGTGQPIVTIHYMTWGNPQQLQTERVVIGRFNALCQSAGKPLRVEMFMPPAGGYPQKLLMMLASGEAPDVARVDHYNFSSWAAKGYFRDLTPIANNDPAFHADDFHPSAMRENYYHGRLYAMNMLFGGMICYYNASLFRAAGLDDPYHLWKKGKWTWAAFEDAATRLTFKDAAGHITAYGFTFGNIAPTANYWGLWLWREKGDYLSSDHQRCELDSPNSLRGFADMRSLIYTLGVCPSTDIAASNRFSLEAGNVAMYFDFAGFTPRYRDSIRDFDWDIAPTPSDPDNSYTLAKGNQLIITEQCKHPQEAWEWIKYLTSKETEEYFYGDEYRRCVPTRWAVLKDPEYLHAARPPFHTDVFVDVLDRARELPIDEAYPTWTATAQRMIEVLFINRSIDLNRVISNCAAAVDVDLQSEHERFQRYAQER